MRDLDVFDDTTGPTDRVVVVRAVYEKLIVGVIVTECAAFDEPSVCERIERAIERHGVERGG